MTTQAQLEEAFQYVWSIAPSPYIHWYSGDVSYYDGPPAWGVNAEAPDASYVQPQGGFCVAVLNLILRKLGLQIPNPFNDPANDGGTYSTYWAYYDQSKWFSNVRNDLPNYALLIAPFVNGVSEGHVAMVWYWNGVPYILEWIYSGLSYAFTSDYSNDNWGYYEIMVPPEVWANLEVSGGDTPLPGENTEFNVDHLLSVYTESLSREDAEAYFPHMLAAFKEFDISNRSRIAAFLSHAAGEVGEFTYWEEIDPDWNRFHGYHGRGPLQCTWYDLYVKLRDAWLIAHPEDPVDFVENPDLVATPKYGFWTSAWFWRHGSGADLNPIADSGDFDTIIQSIYGGYGYDGPYPSRYNLRWAYYNDAMKTLPANLNLGEGAPDPPPPEEESVIVSKYTFVGHGQVATDIAGAAAYALETVGIDTLFYNAPKSIEMAAAKIRETNDPGIANCIVIGKEAASAVSGDWSGDNPIWYADPTPEDSTLSALLFCRSWALDWIAGHGENLPASVKNKLFKVFDGALKLVDEEYGVVLQKVISDNDHNPPPPPPEAERVEMQVEVKNFQDDDLVSVKRKEQK